MNIHSSPGILSRRQFVTGCAAGAAVLGFSGVGLSAAARAASQSAPVLRGNLFDLKVAYQRVNFTGREQLATAINGSVPGPILRWREGERVTLRVSNHLSEDTSIHWHGMILPTEMDGVPGLSFDGIKPGESFEYQFDVKQNGTYWYHSHSGFQEQTGHYGAIVIDPAEPDPVECDRDYVVMLSDWSDEDPHSIYAKLKKMSHYYNFQERTAGDLWRDIRDKGLIRTWHERRMWNDMRMSQTDLADVTGYTYTYLMNGQTPDDNWHALFNRGEKIRLRFINAAAMSIFDVRIPGLKMTVVAADGQNIEPVTVDEFRIGVAETYDVVVQPQGDQAYTVFAQSMDRSGYARGTLTPAVGLNADVPEMDHVPVLSHRDMGMAHDMGGAPNAAMPQDVMHHRHHDSMNGHAMQAGEADIRHAPSEYGPAVDMRAEMPRSGLNDPGVGLREHGERYGRRVLNYGDLRNLEPTRDPREPDRDIQLHLTGNMHRYLWSIDGIKFADAEPLMLKYRERVRITLVNDTMMTHPIHLHGLWSELESGDSAALPRMHTLLVQPGSTISYRVTADALGRWAYHCHLLYHMPGMMREVRVTPGGRS